MCETHDHIHIIQLFQETRPINDTWFEYVVYICIHPKDSSVFIQPRMLQTIHYATIYFYYYNEKVHVHVLVLFPYSQIKLSSAYYVLF